MSLSNMRNEPRREITEQAVGTVVVAAVGTVDYFASVRVAAMDTDKDAIPWGLWMFIIPVALAVAGVILYGLANLTHSIGERISDWMAGKGMDPRPKQRGR